MDLYQVSYFIGIFIVFISHIYMLTVSTSSEMVIHSWANLAAGAMIAVYYTHKENYF